MSFFKRGNLWNANGCTLHTKSGKEKESLLEWYIDIRHTGFGLCIITLQPLILPLSNNNKNFKSANTVKGKQSY